MAESTIIVPGMEMTPGMNEHPLMFDAEKSNWVEMNELDGHSYWKTKSVVPEAYSGDAQAYHLLGMKSKITRDPSNVGGKECEANISNNNIMFTGKIDWYEADEALGRAAGNRVGIMIQFPEDVTEEDLNALRIHIAGKVYSQNVLDEFEGKKVLWYYPLVKGSESHFQVKLVWNPETTQEIFNIYVSPTAELKEAEDAEVKEEETEESK